MRAFYIVLGAALTCLAAEVASSQTADRSVDEIKTETFARSQTGAYPLLGIQPVDAGEALGRIKSRDPDEWAAAWSAIADGYMAKAKAASDPREADANFIKAWRLYYFGQWPAPTSAGKQAAYRRAIDAYLQHARYFDPPLEVVRIPYRAGEIVGYLRLPATAPRPVPLVLAISGLDSRKETVAETYAAALPQGIGFFAVDSPGTGEAPRKADETADDIYSRVLDYLATRSEIDRNRIIVHGQSFGGYWAAKLAHTEANRLAGAVVQSPPIHRTFQPDFFRGRMYTREYLFDLLPASLFVYGLKSADELITFLPKMSLQAQDLLGKPTAPILIVGGTKDTQVPIDDLQLLLNSGSEPREAWINPAGGHMGRTPGTWPDPVIFRRIILPWEIRRLSQKPEAPESPTR
ncbi:MAG TPA: alpha/beta fold hydrolase [Bradyrhizobium sp.]|uniref:alpha/beta fold hydrolase n=1 Tax=Bradyrhizobium sp. TaxID=376 RepID=UPI002CDE4EE7|nr:alpha/beta fold hydrolase [Bradyrhizobium sp.]HXB76283.1 alpha/beta fold hydrolase [Bradyrhizobium sp.]